MSLEHYVINSTNLTFNKQFCVFYILTVGNNTNLITSIKVEYEIFILNMNYEHLNMKHNINTLIRNIRNISDVIEQYRVATEKIKGLKKSQVRLKKNLKKHLFVKVIFV